MVGCIAQGLPQVFSNSSFSMLGSEGGAMASAEEVDRIFLLGSN